MVHQQTGGLSLAVLRASAHQVGRSGNQPRSERHRRWRRSYRPHYAHEDYQGSAERQRPMAFRCIASIPIATSASRFSDEPAISSAAARLPRSTPGPVEHWDHDTAPRGRSRSPKSRSACRSDQYHLERQAPFGSGILEVANALPCSKRRLSCASNRLWPCEATVAISVGHGILEPQHSTAGVHRTACYYATLRCPPRSDAQSRRFYAARPRYVHSRRPGHCPHESRSWNRAKCCAKPRDEAVAQLKEPKQGQIFGDSPSDDVRDLRKMFEQERREYEIASSEIAQA